MSGIAILAHVGSAPSAALFDHVSIWTKSAIKETALTQRPYGASPRRPAGSRDENYFLFLHHLV
jgi:hypothetical protein